jgi:two-component system, OmpR family, phosphate regulon sensor histidine kinase PhoR
MSLSLTGRILLPLGGSLIAGGVLVLAGAPGAWVLGVCAAGASVAIGLSLAEAHSARRRLVRLALTTRQLAEAAPVQMGEALDLADEADGWDRVERGLSEVRLRLVRQVKELAKKTRNLESVVDGFGEPLLVTGNDDGVLLCNRAAEALLGVAPGALAGRGFGQMFTKPDLLTLHSQARSGRAASGQVRLTTAQGSRTFAVTATPLPAAWGEGIFGVIVVLRDVTDLAQAVQLQRDFVANASHELRTPVAALLSAIETLQDGAKDDPAMCDRLLTVGLNHTRRLQDMIRDLMDLSRMESADIPVNLGALDTEELREMLLTSFEPACVDRRLALLFNFDAAVDSVTTDPKLVALILRNLVDNATKFAHQGTTIRVNLRRVPPAGPAEPTRLRLEVVDEGVGIPLDQQGRVFERFYQVDQARTGTPQRNRRGTGLGLAIVKRAVEALRGTVGLESVWGQGTRVWAELPLAAPQTQALDPASMRS